MTTSLVYQKHPNYHILGLKQWFSKVLVLSPIYTLKNNGGSKRAFVYLTYTSQHLPYLKLKLRKFKIINFL